MSSPIITPPSVTIPGHVPMMTFPSGKSRGLVEKGAHMANAVEDLRERGRREPWTVRWLKIRGDRSPRCGKMGRESKR